MEKKNNIGLWIIVIILLIAVGGLGWYAGTKYANKEDAKQTEKNKGSEEQKPEEKKESKLVYLDTYVNKYNGLYGFYEDGTAKLLSDKVLIDHYTIDGNIVYYTNAKGDLFSIDITKDEEPKAYDIIIQNSYFSVKEDKLYFFIVTKDGSDIKYATTLDLKTGEETKDELDVEAINVSGVTKGTNFVFDDTKHISTAPYFYSYDFSTKALTKFESYRNIIENREDYALFEKSGSQDCLYDKKNNKELFCVNKDKESKRVYTTLPTSKDNKVYTLIGNTIKECTDNSCSKDFYTLTDEEANAPYIGMRYVGNSFLLTVGLNEKCEEGCTYDYKTYDLNNEHKEMDYVLDIAGYRQGLFLE